MPTGLLASFAYFNKVDMRLVKARSGGLPLFADSGAFTANSKGANIPIEAYARWLWRYHNEFDVYVNLDVIGDNVGSAKNLTRLREYGLNPVPVLHYGDSVDVLKGILDEGATYIALGGIAFRQHATESKQWIERMFAHTPDNVDVHGFGFTRIDGMLDYPWRSVDSSSWLAGARYSAIRLFIDGSMKTIDLRNPASRFKYADALREHNADVDRWLRGKWHYRETYWLGAVASHKMALHWAKMAKQRGWKEPTLYLAGTNVTLVQAATAIRDYKKAFGE